MKIKRRAFDGLSDNMLPALLGDNIMNSAWVNTEHSCKTILISRALLVERAYLAHLRFAELVVVSFLSINTPTLVVHIGYVVLPSPKKQMVGPDTGRIITTVKDAKSFRNRPIMQLVRNPMGVIGPFTSVCPFADTSIAEYGFAACPYPATLSLVNVGPESYVEWDRACFAGAVYAAIVARTLLLLDRKTAAAGKTRSLQQERAVRRAITFVAAKLAVSCFNLMAMGKKVLTASLTGAWYAWFGRHDVLPIREIVSARLVQGLTTLCGPFSILPRKSP
jgi:hypothetical protein